jgi:hypothetical protein
MFLSDSLEALSIALMRIDDLGLLFGLRDVFLTFLFARLTASAAKTFCASTIASNLACIRQPKPVVVAVIGAMTLVKVSHAVFTILFHEEGGIALANFPTPSQI